MPWTQIYTPLGSLGLSALVAAIPLIVIGVCLAGFKMKAHKAGLLALLSAFIIAVFVWGMPAKMAVLATAQGTAFGLFPVFYIVITTIFLYNITVEGGQFEIIRASLAGLTGDRRIQALLIAFCFGAFIEGAAGFGTPVAIAGATLAGLGFRPLYAAGVCLVANTAPVAFGAIGIPIVALAGVMGYGDEGMMKLSTMVGHQLPFISLFIPFYVIVIMVGFKKTIEVLPAVLVCGGTFAIAQWATAVFLGPYLPDIIASLASIAALVILLQFWQPKENWLFDHEDKSAAKFEKHKYTGGQVFRAWSPYLVLTLMVLLWGIPSIKTSLDKFTTEYEVAGLHNNIVKKVLSAEDSTAKGQTVLAEIDTLLASLPATETAAISALTALKGAEAGLLAVEAANPAEKALTETRLAAFGAVSKASGELDKLVKETYTKETPVKAETFDAVAKAVKAQVPTKVAAKFKFNFFSAAGTAILFAAFISAILCGVGFGALLRVAKKTLWDLRWPAVTVGAVLGLAYVMNASGMTNCLGLVFTKTGVFFPFLAPFLGWLGVFLTGSDTSSNVLFGGLQKATAEQLGVSPILAGAANTSGGVMGKMISPQSLAVATAATGMVGEEGTLFRFTFKHSIILTIVVGIITWLQATVLTAMIP